MEEFLNVDGFNDCSRTNNPASFGSVVGRCSLK